MTGPGDTPDGRLGACARGQHGVVTRAQARACGMSNSMIARRVDQGLLTALLDEVFLVAGVPLGFRQKVTATQMRLGNRGAMSHETAALVHGFEEFKTPVVVEASIATDLRCPAPWLRLHRVRQLEDCDIEVVDAFRVTTPARTLFDLAGILDPDALEHAADFVLRRRLATVRRLRWTVDRLEGKGRAGCKALRTIVEERDPSQPVPESKLERLLLRLLEGAGVERPEVQYEVRDDDGRFIARVDFAFPGVKLAIEADGRDYHYGHARWEQDLRRRSRLGAAGWRVIHITWQRLREDPQGVIEEIARALLA